MGGSGSGWRYSKKTTVEDGLILSMSELVRKKALVTGGLSSGAWCWRYSPHEETFASISYEANLINDDAAWLRLHYSANGEPVDYRIRLVTTKPHYGGLRWWFICPLVRRDGEPPRRVAKLYLPPGAKYFGNREAYGLTYTSCQESGKFNRLFRDLAADTGMTERDVRAALKDGWLP